MRRDQTSGRWSRRPAACAILIRVLGTVLPPVDPGSKASSSGRVRDGSRPRMETWRSAGEASARRRYRTLPSSLRNGRDRPRSGRPLVGAPTGQIVCTPGHVSPTFWSSAAPIPRHLLRFLGRLDQCSCRRAGSSQHDDDQDCTDDRDGVLDEPGGRVAAQRSGEPSSCSMSAERADHGSDDPANAADHQ
jgi:hypothetical protein